MAKSIQNKSTSFWNMKPMKVNHNINNVNQSKNNSKSFFSPKFIQPVNLKAYPKRTSSENKIINKKPWADTDRDGVPNIFDCKPLNRRKQAYMRNPKTGDNFWVYNKEERKKVRSTLRKSGFSGHMTNSLMGMPPTTIEKLEKEGIQGLTHPKIVNKIEQEKKRLQEEGKLTPKKRLDYNKIKANERNAIPEIREKMKERNAIPEIREKRHEYQKKYRARPQVIIKRNEQQRKYRAIPEIRERLNKQRREQRVISEIEKMAPGLEFGEEYKKEKKERFDKEPINEVQDLDPPSQDIVEDSIESTSIDDTTPYEGSAQELIDTTPIDDSDKE